MASLVTSIYGAILLSLLLSAGAWAQTIRVSPDDNLSGIFAQLKGGETVLLEPGVHQALALRATNASGQFRQPVVVKSGNPDAPSTLRNVNLVNVANVQFENIHFKYDFEPGRGVREPRPFYFQNVDRLTISGSVFEGDIAKSGDATVKGFAVGKGLVVRGGSNILIEGNEFYNWFAAAALHHIDRMVFRGNEIHSIRSDGVNCSEMRSALIANNYIHDFRPSTRSKDHRDMIQCWSTNTTRHMDGLTIEGNVLNSGSGAYTQSIFLRNELVDKGLQGRNFYYRNVTIRNNVVINAHRHGIFVGQTDGLVIENNTVVRTRRGAGSKTEKKIYIPAMTVRPESRNVAIFGNIVSEIEGFRRQADWQVSRNQLVQDDKPFQPNHYNMVFASPPGSNIAQVSDFKLKANGPLAGQAIGAPRLRH